MADEKQYDVARIVGAGRSNGRIWLRMQDSAGVVAVFWLQPEAEDGIRRAFAASGAPRFAPHHSGISGASDDGDDIAGALADDKVPLPKPWVTRHPRR